MRKFLVVTLLSQISDITRNAVKTDIIDQGEKNRFSNKRVNN